MMNLIGLDVSIISIHTIHLFIHPPAHYEGPWLRTQIGLALLIGLPSFLLFCSLRTNSTVLFAPRTKLKG